MATNGLLNFNGTNKATFVGANSNIVLDTVNSSLGIGITGTDAPSSNLYITGNAYVSSDLTVSTNTLHVDTTNSRVGVGTVSPDNALHIRGAIPAVLLDDSDDNTKVRITGGTGGDLYVDSNWGGSGNTGDIIFREASSEKMRITGSGNVGIGTTSPSSVFNTFGGALWDGSSMASKVCATLEVGRGGGSGAAANDTGFGGILEFRHHSDSRFVTIESVSEAAYSASIGLRFKTHGGAGDGERMRIDGAGNVGIGTTDPGTALDVLGTIRVQTGTNDATGGEFSIDTNVGHIRRKVGGNGVSLTSYDDFQFYVNATGGSAEGGTQAMIIENNGIVTTPSRPAFYAWDNSTSRSGTTLTFNSTTYNIGSHYNTSTSRFKTPVAGTYIFAAVLAHDTANEFGDAYFSFYVDGVLRRDILEGVPIHDSHYEKHAVYIVNLSANQYVDIRARSGHDITFINGNHGAYYRNCFQGALLG